MTFATHAYGLPESLEGQPYTLATYYLQAESDENADAKAASLAVGQSIGTWTEVPGVTPEMLAHHLARVTGVYEVPPVELRGQLPDGQRSYIVQIAFPEANFGDQLPLLLTTVLGNDISTAARIKLLDLRVSRELAGRLGGPRFGLEGIRQKTGVTDRALILKVLKPCTGFPPEAAVPWFEESARAGSDVIKDDELLADVSFNRLERRVRLFHETAERVYQETGHRALYCANITDRADRTLENLRRAAELGADLVMVNAVAAGLGTLQAVTAHSQLPVLAHFAGYNAMSEAPGSGLASPLLLGKLLRLAGADAVSFPSPYSAYPLLGENFARIARALRLPLFEIKPSLPVPGGGIHPATAARIVRELGNDVMLTVGGGIQGHPGGAGAGVRALHAALRAAAQGQPLAEAAKESPELAAALDRWPA